MNTQKTTNKSKAESKRNRLVVWLSSAALLLAVSVFGGLFYLQRQASTLSERQEIERQGRGLPKRAQIEANADKAVAMATVLRTKWEPWAQSHKRELRAMLQAGPKDKSKLQAVRDILPDVGQMPNTPPSTPGAMGLVSRGDMGKFSVQVKDKPGYWMINPDPNNVAFTWCIGPPRIRLSPALDTSEGREQIAKGSRMIASRQAQDFAEHRDIAIALGSHVGYEVWLWASGRITRKSSDALITRDTYAESLKPPQEVAPPYDFLQ